MTIGIDCDGVLYNYVGYCADFVNDYVGKKVASYENCTDFDNVKAWFPDESIDYRYGIQHAMNTYFRATGVVESIPLLPWAQEFIAEVRYITNGDFRIVTACPPDWHKGRAEALFRDFEIPYKQVDFSYKKGQFKLNALVDDCEKNFVGFDGVGILLNAPWNQSVDTSKPGIVRAKDYEDVLSYIERFV